MNYGFQKYIINYGYYSSEESAMEKTVIRNAYVASQDPLIGNQADLDILIEAIRLQRWVAI